jgi:hypothetical protein
MVKRCLYLFALLAFSGVAISQQNYQDIIYLKNGDILRGILVNRSLNDSVRIIGINGNTVVYNMNEIEKLTRESFRMKKRLLLLTPGLSQAIS